MSNFEVILWDLDGTLRKGVAGWEDLQMPTDQRGSRLNVLVTNNAADASITIEQVHEAGLTFIDRIWTPHVVMQSLSHSLRSNDVFVSRVPETFLAFVHLAHQAASSEQPGRIFCAEPWSYKSRSINMHECHTIDPTVLQSRNSETIWLPDVGTCAMWLRDNARGSTWDSSVQAQIVDIGKSSAIGVSSIKGLVGEATSGAVVGDSHCDSQLANILGYTFLPQ